MWQLILDNRPQHGQLYSMTAAVQGHGSTPLTRCEAGPPGVGCHLFQPPCKPGIAPVARVTAATRKGWRLFLIGVVRCLPSEVQFSVAVHSQVHVSVTAARCQTSVSEGLT